MPPADPATPPRGPGDEDLRNILEGLCPFDLVGLEQRGSPVGGHCPTCGRDYRAVIEDGLARAEFNTCRCPPASPGPDPATGAPDPGPTGRMLAPDRPDTVAPPRQLVGWDEVVDVFLATIDSPHTRRAYRRWLRVARDWLEVAAPAQLDGAALVHFRAALMNSEARLLRLLAGAGRRPALGLGPASQSQGIAALRSFLNWSRAMGPARHLPADLVGAALRSNSATVRRPYGVLSDTEVVSVLGAGETARNRALLAVLLGAGLREAEAVALDVADIISDPDGGTLLHVHGKGRKERTVPAVAEVEAALRAYLASTGRRLGGRGPVFRAHDRGTLHRDRARLGVGAVWTVVHGCARAAGIVAKNVSPHTLRHTFAIRYLRNGGNVVALSKILGHASIATTQRYVEHLELAELRRDMPGLPLQLDS
jgi:integrase/recombinase XerC